jgi:class 3 adenylate cyclase
MVRVDTVPSERLADLVPFVPRLTLEWLRDEPDRLSRELDATIAFVDISGFTAMSEQLSNLGKAGAEEVTDVMNATFAALLDVAYADGGCLSVATPCCCCTTARATRFGLRARASA